MIFRCSRLEFLTYNDFSNLSLYVCVLKPGPHISQAGVLPLSYILMPKFQTISQDKYPIIRLLCTFI